VSTRLEREVRRLRRELRLATRQVPFLRAMIEGTRDMLALIDKTGQVLTANTAFLTFDPGSVSIFELIRHADGSALLMPTDLTDAPLCRYGRLRGTQRDVEVTLDVLPDGDHFIFAARELDQTAHHVRALLDARRQVSSLEATLEAEQTRERSLRRESLAVLAGALAHDLNNSLTVVLGNLDALRQHVGSAAGEALIDQIDSGTASARALIARLMTFSEGTTGMVGPVEVQPWLTALAASLGGGLDRRVEVDLPAAPVTWQGDEVQLTQVVINLVTNAAQATHAQAQIQLRVTSAEGGWYLDCIDRGHGIPVALRDRVFEPFFSTRTGSSGLGLAGCRRAIEAHGGWVRVIPVESGCQIRVFMPLQTVAAPAAPTIDPAKPLTCMTILVMDDEPLVLATMRRLLEHHGARVVGARNGEEALACYDELRATQVRPLVILDLHIANGMDGLTTLEALKARDKHVVALACSGYSRMDVARQYAALGFRAFVSKPFTPAALLEAVSCSATALSAG
jgi:signal transduction histidine kinase/CheY-like chemotaxis protein